MDEQGGASIEKNGRTLLTDVKPQLAKEASRYENTLGTTSMIDGDDKSCRAEGDCKWTMTRVKELVEKMFNRPLDDMEELEFCLCLLKKEHLKEFLLEAVVFKLQNQDYEEIDMSYNRHIEPVGYKNIGKMVERYGVRTVRLVDCDISDDDLRNLFDGMGDAKLEVLDISCTNNVTAKGFAHIVKQVAKNCIKKLRLSDTQLNVKMLTAFHKEVADLIKDLEGQQVLVEEIDVSYNSNMEPEAYEVLGSIMKLFGVKKISLAGCRLRKKHLEVFRKKMNSMQYTKMESLNAGDNTHIGKGIDEIAKIVNECQLEELDISECRFSAKELDNFIKALGEAKLKCLYLGEERQFDENYISQVCNLLPHIKETLRLQGTVRNHPRSMLQKELDTLIESELEIKLDDGVTLRAQIKDEITTLAQNFRIRFLNKTRKFGPIFAVILAMVIFYHLKI